MTPDEFVATEKGPVYIRGDEGVPTYIQIVASIEIGPNDWGGVAFYIPDKNIISSYPENKPQSKPRTT